MLKYTINNLKLFKSRNTMPPRKLIIFIYLLFKATQPSMASEVFYTNTIDPDSYLNFGRTIRKVELNDNTYL